MPFRCSLQVSHFRTIVVAAAIVWAPLQGAHGQASEINRGRELQKASIEAYRAGDYVRFVDLTEKALAARPGHPTLLYNLAGGYALTERKDRAISLLERYADYGLSASPELDSDFDSLADDARFHAVLARFKANATPCERSTIGFSIPDDRFFAEGLAFDALTGQFYVTSVARRSISSVEDGLASTFAELGDGDVRSPLGIAIDLPRRMLWVSASAVAEITDEQAAPALIAFDLDSGERLREVRHPSESGFLGDVAVRPGGMVLVSDPLNGMVYRLSEDAERLVPAVPDDVLSSPQGIAAGGDENTAYISDYAQGIFRMDLAGGQATRLPEPEDAMLLGIDGLVAYKGGLIAIQNGVRPARVLRLDLSAEGDRIVKVSVLESNHSAYDEPTTGVVVGDEFWYIANGQWGKMSGEKTTSAPIVLRLSLEE